MKEGQISEVGTYEELVTHDGPFAQFLKEHLTREQMEGAQEEEEDPEGNIKPALNSLKDGSNR